MGPLVLFVMTLGGVGSAQAATDTYRFRGKLESDEGAANGNVLVPTYNNGTLQEGTFVETVVDPNACSNAPTVRGYSFPEFGGLRSPNNAPVVVGESYTISMIVKFSPLRSGYTRLIDFSDSTLDDGIYVLNGEISFYPVGTYAPDSFANDRFSVLTLTRDGATNVVSLFIGLTPAGTYVDTEKRYVPSAGNMYFFMDNTTGAAAITESSPGVVTFLRVSDRPTTPEALAETVNEACEAVACGNQKLEGTEACDDGNNVDGDGCSSTCKVENGLACGAVADAGAGVPDAGAGVPDAGDGGDAGHVWTVGDNCQSGVCDPRDSRCGYDNGAESTCDASNAAVVCRSKVCGAASMKCIPEGGCFVDGDCPASSPSCDTARFTCVTRADAASPPAGGTIDAGDLNIDIPPPSDEDCSCRLGPRPTSVPAIGLSLLVSAAAIARSRLRRRPAREDANR